MGEISALMAALAVGLVACAAPLPTASGTAAGSALGASPHRRATMCIATFRANAMIGAATSDSSFILMSDNGWCGLDLPILNHGVSIMPKVTILVPPAHGIVSADGATDQTFGIYFEPELGFIGPDEATLSARYGPFDATYRITVVVTGADGIFKAEPPPHSLPHGVSVLVRDGTCPSGHIKQVTSGRPRKIVCIPFSG